MTLLFWSRFVVCGAASLAMAGCANRAATSPYTDNGDAVRNPERARELVTQAKLVAQTNPAQSEALLREALAADLYCGPAHNNLGTLLLERGNLYEAAGEFQWAKKLLPGLPDPRVNLAMTLERAGRTDEALESYDSALAVYENYLPALQGKSRLEIETGRTTPHTAHALDEIAMRGDEQWRAWAMVWRAKLSSMP